MRRASTPGRKTRQIGYTSSPGTSRQARQVGHPAVPADIQEVDHLLAAEVQEGRRFCPGKADKDDKINDVEDKRRSSFLFIVLVVVR